MNLFDLPCPHCRKENTEGVSPWPYCQSCGHRTDKPTLVCDCPRCDPAMFLPATVGERQGA